MITIRKLEPSDDFKSIGKIYVDSWKYAYKGIIFQEYLDNLSSEQWENSLDKDNRYTLIAELDGKMIATASYGKSRDDEYAGQGEIYSIYFLPEYIGKGYGKQLINVVIKQLYDLGYKKIFLWVLKDNFYARRFYEKVGFFCSGKSKEVQIGGQIVIEVQYVIVFNYE